MHAIILVNHPGAFPPALLPYKGKSILNYVIDEVFLQKQISHISIVATPMTHTLIAKHLATAYPDNAFTLTVQRPDEVGEYIELDGAVYTSLRLQDLIRYYQQFKTITYAAYDKTNPQPIPFTVYPPYEKRDTRQTHTYNCGTGVCHFAYVPL